MDDIYAQIEAEYCPPVDPALASAILYDYDLSDPKSLASAKQTLDTLKEDAILNEAAGFDPSGTGAEGENTVVNGGVEPHVEDTSVLRSWDTDSTSLTNGVSSLDLEDEPVDLDFSDDTYDEIDDFDKLDEATKIRRLQAIFTKQISRYTIQHTLRKCNGKWDAAVEDLLSQAFLANAESTSNGDIVVAKGVDGFSDDGVLQRGRKGRAKNKKRMNLNERRPDSLPGTYDGDQTSAQAVTSNSRSQDSGGIQIIPRYAPLEGIVTDTSWNEVIKKARSTTSSRSSSLDIASSVARRDAYSQAQALAFSKASAAHRKAKSDRLMGGAAAYYGQLGREYAALSHGARATTADNLVALQSQSNELDLHGVDVLNAVRIAQEKVEEWWHGLGENRINGRIGAGDRLAGYRIVVGLGRHSEGGRSKLGPAITKMLKQEGWRIESTGAVITVKGPPKR